MKRCYRCKKEKNLDEFCLDYRKEGRVSSRCRVCAKEERRIYYSNNKIKVLTAIRKWQKENAESIRLKRKERNKTNLWHYRKWREKNPEKAKVRNKYNNALNLSTPKGKLRNRVSRSINYHLRGVKQNRHLEDILGYTMEQLRKHIEKNFIDGMSWERLNEIHIDHIVPVSAFNFSKVEDIDFKRCWGMENLRPMWAKDNLSKGKKLLKVFQPSLQIGG